ncbi:hypothetical protein AURDEDRAFT_177024 [Auricularia subglabra TFB-10046 SS5]|uniref:Uncharacterized protein n=1 Tax=Auricularia subglabra (strain TFB-10046 / SS5) TaxID=717982 RepID=J0WNF7_AURST|nr:hypothetical protein AURDEDRAFT_177024 [Auricularia subglabra TFB-10046 SS5]
MVNSDNSPLAPTPTSAAPAAAQVPDPGTLPSTAQGLSDMRATITDPTYGEEASPLGQLQMAEQGTDGADVPLLPSDYSDESDGEIDVNQEDDDVNTQRRRKVQKRVRGRSVRRARAAQQPRDRSGRFLPRPASAPPSIRSPVNPGVDLEGVKSSGESAASVEPRSTGAPLEQRVEVNSLHEDEVEPRSPLLPADEVEHGSPAEDKVELGSPEDDAAQHLSRCSTPLTYTDAGMDTRRTQQYIGSDVDRESGYASYADLTLQDGPAPPIQPDEEGWYTESSIAEARDGMPWLTPQRVARWREDVEPHAERSTEATNRFSLLTVDPLPETSEESSSLPQTPTNRFPPVLPQITPVSAEFAAEFRDYESPDEVDSDNSHSPASTNGYSAGMSSDEEDTFVASPPITPSSDYRGERVATPEVIARTGLLVHSATVTASRTQQVQDKGKGVDPAERGYVSPQASPVKNERLTPVAPGTGDRWSLPPTVGIPLFGPPFDPSQYRREPSVLPGSFEPHPRVIQPRAPSNRRTCSVAEWEQLGRRADFKSPIPHRRELLCPFYNWEEEAAAVEEALRKHHSEDDHAARLRNRSQARASHLARLFRLLAAEVEAQVAAEVAAEVEAEAAVGPVVVDLEAAVPVVETGAAWASLAQQELAEVAMAAVPETGADTEVEAETEAPAVLLGLLRLFLGLLQHLISLLVAILGVM